MTDQHSPGKLSELHAKVTALEYLPSHVSKLDDAIGKLTSLVIRVESTAEDTKEAVRVLSRPRNVQWGSLLSAGLSATALIGALVLFALQPLKENQQRFGAFKQKHQEGAIEAAYRLGKQEANQRMLEENVLALWEGYKKTSNDIASLQVASGKAETASEALAASMRSIKRNQTLIMLKNSKYSEYNENIAE